MQSGALASALLEPISPASPCGRDLEDSLELYALETAAREPDEPSIGGIASVDTRNWRDIASKAQTLLKTSKDLRIAVHLARALLSTEGLTGFAHGVAIVRGLVEQYWEGLFPALDPSDPDPQMRITALRELWSTTLLSQLRATAVISHRELGNFTVNDVLAARNAPEARTANGARASAAHVLKALELSPATTLAPVYHAVCALVDDLTALSAAVTEHVGPGYRLDPTPLIGAREDRSVSEADGRARSRAGVLGRLSNVLGTYVADAHPERDGAAIAGSADSADRTDEVARGVPNDGAQDRSDRGLESPPMRTGEIRSREDVIRMLEQIGSYYARYEPSSPVPLLLERARTLVPMSFLDAVRSLASKGLPQIELIAGIENDGDHDD